MFATALRPSSSRSPRSATGRAQPAPSSRPSLCRFSWRRVAIILTCFYVGSMLFVLRSIGGLHGYGFFRTIERNGSHPFSSIHVELESILKDFTGLETSTTSSSASTTTGLPSAARTASDQKASTSTPAVPVAPSSTSEVVAAVNAVKQPRVDDWYKENLQAILKSVAGNDRSQYDSCRKSKASNGLDYYSLDPLAACRSNDKKVLYFNPFNRTRFFCGKAINATESLLFDEPCLEPPRLFPVIPSTKTASQLPPTVVRFNDPSGTGDVKSFDDCNVPCFHGGHLHILSTRTVDNTPFRFMFSMEGPQYYPQLTIRDFAYRDHRFFSTTSFRSEVPLPYFSYVEYKIQNEALDYDKAEKAAVFLARNCGSKSHREELVKSLQESPHFRIDSLSNCLKNAQPPPGLGLNNKNKVMNRYLFYLAFENQREDDYVTEKLWGPYVAGTIPVYFGAPNIKELAPKNSYIDVDDFSTPDDLAVYLNKVANNRTLYESYHAWRKLPLSPNFTGKYNISKIHSTCRTCRWAFAKVYGLGWNHENQTVSDQLRSTTSRKVCLERSFIARPFREVWIDALTNEQVVVDGKDGGAVASSSSCEEVNSQTNYVHLDQGRLKRTIYEQDGVVDIVIERDAAATDQEQIRKGRQAGSHRKVRLRLETPLEGTVILSHVREGQVRFQNQHSRVTLLTWPTRVANAVHVAATDGSSLVLDLHHLSAHSIFPLRLRLFMEDVDLFHKDAADFENYFGSTMVEDFFHPIEAFQ